MVHRQQQHVLRVAQPQQRGAQQRARAPGRRAAAPPRRRSRRASASRASRGRRARSTTGSAQRRGRVDELHGLPVAWRERGAQRLVARDELLEGALAAPRTSSAPSSRSADGDVVGGAAGLELVEEPQALLREGQRQRAVARHADQRRGAAARVRRAARVDARGERRHAWAPRRARAAAAPRRSARADARDHLRGQQRVAAQLEEVVVRRPPAPRRSTSAQMPASSSSGRRARGDVGARGAGAPPPGAGSALRSTLPLGVSGSASSTHEGRRHHVLGQPLRAGSARSAVGVQRRRPRRRRRPPAACRRARPRAPRTTASRTPGCCAQRGLDLAQLDAEAAHLHLVVERGPGTRCVPSGSQRARSPVRYSRAPGAALNGSGTKRSAVSSGRPR